MSRLRGVSAHGQVQQMREGVEDFIVQIPERLRAVQVAVLQSREGPHEVRKMEERYKVDVLTLRGELLYRRTFTDFNSANVMFENQLNDDDHFIAYTPYDVLMISLDDGNVNQLPF